MNIFITLYMYDGNIEDVIQSPVSITVKKWHCKLLQCRVTVKIGQSFDWHVFLVRISKRRIFMRKRETYHSSIFNQIVITQNEWVSWCNNYMYLHLWGHLLSTLQYALYMQRQQSGGSNQSELIFTYLHFRVQSSHFNLHIFSWCSFFSLHIWKLWRYLKSSFFTLPLRLHFLHT